MSSELSRHHGRFYGLALRIETGVARWQNPLMPSKAYFDRGQSCSEAFVAFHVRRDTTKIHRGRLVCCREQEPVLTFHHAHGYVGRLTIAHLHSGTCSWLRIDYNDCGRLSLLCMEGLRFKFASAARNKMYQSSGDCCCVFLPVSVSSFSTQAGGLASALKPYPRRTTRQYASPAKAPVIMGLHPSTGSASTNGRSTSAPRFV